MSQRNPKLTYYKPILLPYKLYNTMPMVRTDAWNNNILSNFIVWTQLTVYVPKVSHNTFDVSGYDIYLLYYTEYLTPRTP